MRLFAIPNVNDNQMFDLVEKTTSTNTVWACLMRDVFYTSDKAAHDALQDGKILEVELSVYRKADGTFV